MKLLDTFSNAIFDELGVSINFNHDNAYDIIGDDDIGSALARYEITIHQSRLVTSDLVNSWWQETLTTAIGNDKIPLLAYREDQKAWSIVIPINEIMTDVSDEYPSIDWTVTFSIMGFAAMVREKPNINV